MVGLECSLMRRLGLRADQRVRRTSVFGDMCRIELTAINDLVQVLSSVLGQRKSHRRLLRILKKPGERPTVGAGATRGRVSSPIGRLVGRIRSANLQSLSDGCQPAAQRHAGPLDIALQPRRQAEQHWNLNVAQVKRVWPIKHESHHSLE